MASGKSRKRIKGKHTDLRRNLLLRPEVSWTLADVRTFLEVVDAGGVSPAARRLGVSKSIVSRRLARVEQALGVQLLSRTTHGAVQKPARPFANMPIE